MDRNKAIERLMIHRANWELRDFVDAYHDEWESDIFDKPLGSLFEVMEEYISLTYDDGLLKELIEVIDEENLDLVRDTLEKEIINDANVYGDTTVLYSLLEMLPDDVVWNALSDKSQEELGFLK